MIKKLLAAFLIWFCFVNNIKAQTILNPSFENVSVSSCAYNLSNNTFNNYMANVYAFGTYENCDIINSSCGYGTAQDGNWFVALSVPPGALLYDAIAVELSAPMQAGQQYEFSFYQKKDLGYDSNPLDIGYSDNDSTMGIPAAALPAVTSTSWILTSVTFTPSYNAQYITMRAAPTVYGWNQIDNMQLTNITAISEENLFAPGLEIYPNPSNEYAVISFQFGVGDEVIFSDALGKILFTKKITAPILNFKLQTSNFQNGIYFLSVRTHSENVQTEKNLLTRKIAIQH